MTHASLFSGIGGFDLAAEWMGWQNLFHCEWNPFGQQVLKHHFPQSISYHDITKTDFTIHRGTVDILTGGFPCQPYSTAGKQLGKADERHLFPEMLRCIKEVKPRWVIGENVRGLVGWNGGMVFDEVCADLESEGYEVQPFLIPAAGINAPHKRERIWFVAHSNSIRLEGRLHEEGFKRELSTLNASTLNALPLRNSWQNFSTKSPICGGDDGLPTKLDSISVPKWRKQSIMAYGNAVVPQVAHQLFKTIQEYEIRNQRS